MNDSKKKINLDSLISTRNFLAEIMQVAQSNYEKAGEIQSFEVCYELAKHTIVKVLTMRGLEVLATPKEIFRLAAKEGLISDAEIWFKFAKQRNRTSHAYDSQTAQEILANLPEFLQYLDLLIIKLKQLPECSN
jgi:nucleotidyltransferase substrate binding protein (TIGR01987 family)